MCYVENPFYFFWINSKKQRLSASKKNQNCYIDVIKTKSKVIKLLKAFFLNYPKDIPNGSVRYKSFYKEGLFDLIKGLLANIFS